MTLQGGNGERIVNIASTYGLITQPELLTIDDVGYPIAKHGVVALTRSFKTIMPSIEASEGIKCYAICPYFADTNLVRQSIAIKDLTSAIKGRALLSSVYSSGIMELCFDFSSIFISHYFLSIWFDFVGHGSEIQ